MEFGLSEEQTLLQDSLADFLEKEVTLDVVRQFNQSRDGTEIWRKITDLGLAGLLFPEEAGGSNSSIFDCAIINELFGYHVTPNSFIGSSVLLPRIMLQLGSRVEESFVDQLLSGASTVGLALGEAIGIRADGGIEGNGNQLTGKALYVHDFNATHYLVADSKRRIYLVDKNADRLKGAVLSTIDGSRVSGVLTFDKTPAYCLSENEQLLTEIIDIGRIMLAADSLGAAQSMLDKAVSYSKTRKQFGRLIGSFQAVKHMCAEMAADLEPCRAMLWYAAHSADAIPHELHIVACHTKAHISEVTSKIAKTAIEVHGGVGFTDLLGLHYWFKRIGYNRQMLGTPELIRQEAAIHV
mgnify:CR=1 FL=1|tara:strand:- start:845 stop:1903 length:1059 start_codon:yes stop_codon:yes gene_type:complete